MSYSFIENTRRVSSTVCYSRRRRTTECYVSSRRVISHRAQGSWVATTLEITPRGQRGPGKSNVAADC